MVMRSPIEEIERKELFGGRESLSSEPHFFIRYRLTPANGLSLEEAAARVLIITTLRTMRKLKYETNAGRLENAGSITNIDSSGYVEIALPLSYCSEREGLTHLLLMITAAAEYNYTETFWIESVELPKEFLERYDGPRFGIDGIRNLFQIPDRPIIGLIIKPRTGVSISNILDNCSEALRGGVDFLVDDLLMVDPNGELEYNSRISYFSNLVNKITDITGEKKLYFANIGLTAIHAAEYAQKGVEVGVGGVLVDSFTMGLGGVEYVVNSIDGKIPVISTNMGSGIMTRGSLLGSSKIYPTGLSEAVIAKLSRVAGVDAVHTGTSASECYGEEAWGLASRSLGQKLFGLAPSMAVAEGDLSVVNLWDNIRSLGRNLLVEPTSGIINYPGGPGKGAAAFRLLAEELVPEMTAETAHLRITELSKKNSDLKRGLKYFGYAPP